MKKIILSFIILVSAIILVACSDKREPRTGEQVEITQTVSITIGYDDKGEPITKSSVVKQNVFINPKRVATFSYSALDILNFATIDLAGIEVLGLPKSSIPNSLKQFDNSKYPNIGTLFIENQDVLDLMDPELIILDGRSASLYSKLIKAYPYADIIDVSNSNYSLKVQNEVVSNLGKIFPAIKEVINNEMNEINSLFETISNKTKDYNATFIISNGEKFSTSSKGSRYNVVFDEFGFIDANPSSIISGSHGDDTTLEALGKINPNIIFIMDRAAAIGDESGLDSLIKLPQFKALDASKNDHVYKLDGESWYLAAGGFTSVRQMIEDIKQFTDKL